MATLAALVVAGAVIAGDKQAPVKAPQFTLTNYTGEEVKLADFKGKIVVLEWFNYECPFSRYHHETVATMKNIANKYKDKGLVWLAINSTGHQETDQNKEFAEKNGVPFPILNDSPGATGKAYGAKTTPHIFIVDTEGNIAYNGAIDNAPLGNAPDKGEIVNYADKALAELTAGEKVSTPQTKPYGCSVKYNK